MTQPDFTSPIAGRIEVREPCPWCPDRQMVPRSLMDEHIAQMHPDVQTVEPSADRAALRDRIAEALEQADYRPDMRRGDLADAIMPVLPPPVSRADVRLSQAERDMLRYALDLAQEQLYSRGDEFGEDDQPALDRLRRMADEAQPDTEAAS